MGAYSKGHVEDPPICPNTIIGYTNAGMTDDGTREARPNSVSLGHGCGLQDLNRQRGKRCLQSEKTIRGPRSRGPWLRGIWTGSTVGKCRLTSWDFIVG